MSDLVAEENWQRFNYALTRGHRNYTEQAQLCERMYLGGGRQWSPEDKAVLDEQKRPAYEFNEILPSINSAIGHQLHNRMDITFKPRGGDADQARADTFAKVTMQIADNTHLHWKETEVFGDGLIQQRGYFDVRMEFDSNMQGNLQVTVPDPLDIIPDPDAKTYEPEGWADVLWTRWLTYDEVEGNYGKKARQAVEQRYSSNEDADWGDSGDDSGAARNKFGDAAFASGGFDALYRQGNVQRVRIIDRQKWVRSMTQCLFYPRTGDLKVAENLSTPVLMRELEQGAIRTKAMQKRVRWTASTMDIALHNEWSEYNGFTIIPYFALFRRGQTIGLVDNAIGPQQANNKALSQFVHIVNSAANSGWIVEENSLVNMDSAELEHKGAMTGLVLEFKKGSAAPQKIQPNQVPQGVDRLIELTRNALKNVTVPDPMRGMDGADTSGVARQHAQFASQQQIGLPLDNLARTRHLLAEKFRDLIQQFYTDERVIRITETDFATGEPIDASVTINQMDPMTGEYANDLTVGDYDAVVTEQPAAVTFENSQFQQALAMRKEGVAIPDSTVVQHSSLTRKKDVLEEMARNAANSGDPLAAAKAELIKAQTVKTQNESVNVSVEGMFSATQAANQIAAVPQVAPLADQLLKSAGFIDMDGPPIVPTVPEGVMPGAIDVQENTSPLFPARTQNPGEGLMHGIETIDQGVPQ